MQARFELDGEYEKAAVIKHMGCLWRSSKSRLVQNVINAKNNAERMKLRPKNIPIAEWRKYVKLKTSPEFKVLTCTKIYFIYCLLTFFFRLLVRNTRREDAVKFLTHVVGKEWLDWEKKW